MDMMEKAAEKKPEQREDVETSAGMALVPEAESDSVPTPTTTSSSVEGASAQGPHEMIDEQLPSESSSVKPPSFVLAATLVNADSLREALLNSSGVVSAVDDPGTSSKQKKKKKKRPKSAQTSSSGSGLSNQAASGHEDGVEAALTDSLEAMSVTDASAAEPVEMKQKKKRKKKKKEKGDSCQNVCDASSADVEMKDVSEREGGQEEQKTEPQGAGQVSCNLQQLTQNLLVKQERRQQYPQQQEVVTQDQAAAQPAMTQPVSGQSQKQQQSGQQFHQQHRTDQRQGQGKQQQQQQQQQQNKNSPQKKQKKKNVFEPYWSQEELSAALKRGTVIEGPIRINPRNYEDAYVPLPDGTADIYISGMVDRNRALNGDVVAVLIQDRDNWRVFTEEVDNYEKCNSPMKTERASEGGTERTDAANETVPKKENESTNKEGDTDAKEQDPDVLVEEEEEVELDCSGRPVEGTLVTRPVTGAAATPAQTTSTTQPPTPATPEDAGNSAGGRGTGPKDQKRGHRNQGSCSKGKRYKSVKEVMDQASPMVRRLFDADSVGGRGEDGGEERRVVNTDKFIQRTGKVVAIVEKKHSRVGSGNLRPMQDSNHNFAIFAPSDPRVPRIMIPTAQLPAGFKERPEDFTRILFIGRITEWHESSKMPRGALARSLGEAGQLEPETEALLVENNIDTSDFTEAVLACLPQESPWTIPAKELEWRRDLRKECVFTIDPSTARDLDDALHCRDLGDGVYEVGVHIADVSYFVEEKTDLDEVARQRATSVYLVQKVIPMLPRLLCEQLCSLNPDEDRLSFSVIWKLTEEGQILEEWFGRTVIRSCVKLSYDHAQGFIEDPDREWTTEELPPISEGFTVGDIKTRVLQMDKIAKALRKARFDGGALRLDQVKIQYTLNKESGLPNGYFVYEQRDSNKLVEEFMLLANMAVAHKIRSAYREKAVLRRHPPPQTRMIIDLKELCCSLGFPIEVETAKDIQLSLARYMEEDELSQARLQILVAMCSRPMRNAKYFCCGMLEDETLYSHYALNVPLYTHFTSPIRRFPDILVHRTLAAALGYCEVTNRSSALLQDMAEHCNDMKTNAKQCSEKSNELYFAIFVKEAGPLEEKGMVMTVLDKSFDVFILRLGVIKRVYCEKLPLEKFTHRKEGKRVELTLAWKPDENCPHVITQKLSIFSTVNCVLQSESEPLKWSAFIRRPTDGDASVVR